MMGRAIGILHGIDKGAFRPLENECAGDEGEDGEGGGDEDGCGKFVSDCGGFDGGRVCEAGGADCVRRECGSYFGGLDGGDVG